MVAKLKLNVIHGREPPEVEPTAYFDTTRDKSTGSNTIRINLLDLFRHFVGGATISARIESPTECSSQK